jgi:CubicO group peptidase (beta-lactamase class C family)
MVSSNTPKRGQVADSIVLYRLLIRVHDFVDRASAPLYHLRKIEYGFLWWGINWPYKDRPVHAYFAGGNGGQAVIVVPELDVVIATFAADYADTIGVHIQQDFPPNYILPTVRELGDDKNAPVIQREFTTHTAARGMGAGSHG